MELRDYFVAALLQAIEDKGCTQKDVADYINAAPPTLNQFIRKTRNFSETKCSQIAEFFDSDYLEMLLTGRQLLKKESPATPVRPLESDSRDAQIIEFQSQVEKEHFHIIQQFKNKEKALEFNNALLEIEDHNIKDFYKFYADVVGYAEELKQKRQAEEQAKVRQETPDEKEA